jgi:hypothetical protein
LVWRFAPDIDPTTPQIYTAMARMMPTPWGTYRSSPSRTTLAGTITSSLGHLSVPTILLRTDGTARWIAAEQDAGGALSLFDSTDGSSWTYVAGWAAIARPSNDVQYGQFGNVSIAVGRNGTTKASSTTGGAFADLAGSPPKANLIAVQSNVVLLFDTDNGVNVYTDGWYASDVGDHTNWSTGEAANGRLLNTPGAIKCAIAFADRVLAFKDTSVYEGQYVGGVVKWAWRVLHPAIGCSSPNGAATDGKTVFFYGTKGAYIYDGVQFTPVDDGVYKYLSTNYPASGVNVIHSASERVFSISTDSGTPVMYCPSSGLWGVAADSDPLNLWTGFGVIAQMKIPPGYARHVMTQTGIPPVTMGFHRMDGTSYASVVSSVKTGWLGNDKTITDIQRVTPQFVPDGDYSYGNGTDATYPAKLTLKASATRGGTMSQVTNSPVYINTAKGRFDILSGARWQEITIEDMSGASSGMAGGMELSGIDVTAVPGGTD